MAKSEDEFLTIDEVARILKVSQSTVSRAIQAEEFPVYRIQDTVRVKRSELEESLRERGATEGVIHEDSKEFGLGNLFKGDDGKIILATQVRWSATLQSYQQQEKTLTHEGASEKVYTLRQYIIENHKLESFRLLVPKRYRTNSEDILGVEPYLLELTRELQEAELLRARPRFSLEVAFVNFPGGDFMPSVMIYDEQRLKMFPPPLIGPGTEGLSYINFGVEFPFTFDIHKVRYHKIITIIKKSFDRAFSEPEADHLVWPTNEQV